MSEQSSLGPSPVGPEPSHDVIFRTLTPVFIYEIQGATCFNHSGHFKNVRFEIVLQPYDHRTDFAEITKIADAPNRDWLQQREIHKSDHYWHGPEPHILIIDVTHPASSIQDNLTGQSEECWAIEDAVMAALRLHSSRGLPSHETYTFRHPSKQSGVMIRSPNTHQCRYSYLGATSVLRSTEFEACRSTINMLLKGRNKNTTFDKVLCLAMGYHRLCFTLEDVAHAFLIIMVVFEALFKKETEDNASKAALRIGRLLGATKQKCQAVQREFNDDPVDSFCKIRNRIAHGDPNLNSATVESKYPSLYRHVTSAIVTLLNLPTGSLDETMDYYDEISRIAETRFLALQNT